MRAVVTNECNARTHTHSPALVRLHSSASACAALGRVNMLTIQPHTYTFSQNGFMIFLGFGAFAGITMIVLLVMDVLECFLHALRLQWVEFMNVR